MPQTCCSRLLVARLAAYLLIAVAIQGLCGCNGPPLKKAPFGTVTCGEEKVEQGSVRFVPIRDTKGSSITAYIADGQYRFHPSEGLSVGWYRVEIVAKQKTGRRIPDRGIVGRMIDQWEPISDDSYARDQSPLQVEITADSEGRQDFDIPHRSR